MERTNESAHCDFGFTSIKRMIMNATMRKFIGLVAGLMLATSAWATTQSLDPLAFPSGGSLTFTALNGSAIGSATCLNVNDPACGTLPPSHGGQTVGWGYQIEDLSSYWFEATGVTSSGLSFSTSTVDVFDYPIIAPSNVIAPPSYYSGTATQQFSATASTGLFEITWNTGLPFNTHESGFFTVSADLYNGDPFGGGSYVGSVALSAPYDSSAPEPYSVLLFATAFGVALWVKARTGASRGVWQQVGRS